MMRGRMRALERMTVMKRLDEEKKRIVVRLGRTTVMMIELPVLNTRFETPSTAMKKRENKLIF